MSAKSKPDKDVLAMKLPLWIDYREDKDKRWYTYFDHDPTDDGRSETAKKQQWRWKKDLGDGAFGEVFLQQRQMDSKIELRAVKRLGRRDFSELKAIAKIKAAKNATV